MSERSRLAEICAALNEAGVNYVLVGAQAGILWGHARTTRDVDILIEATEANATRLIAAIESLEFILARELSADRLVHRPVTVISSPIWRLEVLTVAWSIHYPEARGRARVFEIEGVPVPTASIDDLIRSKRTGRLQDAADIEVLEAIRRLNAIVE